MAKLYGLGNVVISEVATRLMTNPDFYKFVYYKDIDEEGEDILSMPDLDNPVDSFLFSFNFVLLINYFFTNIRIVTTIVKFSNSKLPD